MADGCADDAAGCRTTDCANPSAFFAGGQ